MGSRVVGCQTPRSSGSRPGIQGPEGPASRKHHGTTRARTGAWLRAIFATRGTDRAGGSNCGKDPAVPTWILKTQFDRAGPGFASHDVSLPCGMVRFTQIRLRQLHKVAGPAEPAADAEFRHSSW